MGKRKDPENIPANGIVSASSTAAIKESKPRKTGLSVVGDVPWGTHFCQFYRKKEDLLDILVPYFKAGLENNEYCMWVTAEPLNVNDAKRGLSKAVPDLDQRIAKGQIWILPHTNWYLKGGDFDQNRVLGGWVRMHDEALKNGYAGLRLTGNTFWLEKKDWKSFRDYEAVVNNVLGKYKILALCTYSLDKCDADKILDVLANHEFALARREGNWEIIESAAHQQLKQAREKMGQQSAALSAAYNGIIITDREGRVIWANSAFTRLTGYTLKEIVGRNPRMLKSGQHDQKFYSNLWRTILAGGVWQGNVVNKRKDGSLYYEEMTVTPVKDARGEITQFIAIKQDITARKKAEEQLESTAKFPQENPNAVFRAASDGVILYSNKGGKPLLDMWRCAVGTALPDEYRDFVGNALQSGDMQSTELVCNERTISLSFVPIKSVNYVNIYGVDITELRRTEKKYRGLYESVHDGIVRTDLQGRIVECNQAYADMLGYTKDELKGITYQQLTPKKWHAFQERVIRNILFERGYSNVYEKEYIKKDGTIFPVELRDWLIKDADGNVTGIWGFVRDITEEKRNETIIRYNANLINMVGDAILSADKNFIIRSWNKGAEILFGWKADEVIGRPARETLRTEFPEGPAFRDILMQVLEKGHWKGEARQSHRDGRKIDVLASISAIKDDDGNFAGVVTANRDITEIKQAQNKLKDSEERYALAQRAANMGSWDWDIVTGGLKWSDTIEPMFGFEKGKFGKTYEAFLDCIHPSDRKHVVDSVTACVEYGSNYDVEHRVIWPDGSVRWVSEIGDVIRDKNGKAIRMLGIVRDITEQKELEEEVAKLKHKNIDLTDNEKQVLFSMVKWPYDNDGGISNKTGIKRSTVTAIKNRMLESNLVEPVYVPNFFAMLMEFVCVSYGKTHETDLAKKLKTRDSRFDAPETVLLYSSGEEFASVSFFQKIADAQAIGGASPDILGDGEADNNAYLPLAFCNNLKFLDYENALGHVLGIATPESVSDEQRKAHYKLTNKEKEIFYALVKYPKATGAKLAKLTGITAATINKARDKFINDGILRKVMIPNMPKLRQSLVIMRARLKSADSISTEACKKEISAKMNDIVRFEQGNNLVMAGFLDSSNSEEELSLRDAIEVNHRKGLLPTYPDVIIFDPKEVRLRKIEFAPLVKKILGIKEEF